MSVNEKRVAESRASDSTDDSRVATTTVDDTRAARRPAARVPAIWVLDTNVVLDWLWFSDPAFAPLKLFLEATLARRLTMLATRADCRFELERVLGYANFSIDTARRGAILAAYDAHHAIMAPASNPNGSGANPLPACRDPDDQKFLEVARDVGAHWLITRDTALLELAGRVRHTHGFAILEPRAAAILCNRGAGIDEEASI